MTNEQAIDVLNMVEAHGLADEAKKLAIKALQNDRPQGEWVRTPNEHRVDICCTNCGYDDGYSCFNFCPNCGADMRCKEE